MYPSADKAKIVRHVPERSEDHRVFELAEFGTSLPREGDGSRVHLISGHCLRASDRSGGMRTFRRFARRQAAVDADEWQRHVVHHHRPPRLDALTIYLRTNREQ